MVLSSSPGNRNEAPWLVIFRLVGIALQHQAKRRLTISRVSRIHQERPPASFVTRQCAVDHPVSIPLILLATANERFTGRMLVGQPHGPVQPAQ